MASVILHTRVELLAMCNHDRSYQFGTDRYILGPTFAVESKFIFHVFISLQILSALSCVSDWRQSADENIVIILIFEKSS